jgi:hypothetical protein
MRRTILLFILFLSTAAASSDCVQGIGFDDRALHPLSSINHYYEDTCLRSHPTDRVLRCQCLNEHGFTIHHEAYRTRENSLRVQMNFGHLASRFKDLTERIAAAIPPTLEIPDSCQPLVNPSQLIESHCSGILEKPHGDVALHHLSTLGDSHELSGPLYQRELLRRDVMGASGNREIHSAAFEIFTQSVAARLYIAVSDNPSTNPNDWRSFSGILTKDTILEIARKQITSPTNHEDRTSPTYAELYPQSILEGLIENLAISLSHERVDQTLSNELGPSLVALLQNRTDNSDVDLHAPIQNLVTDHIVDLIESYTTPGKELNVAFHDITSRFNRRCERLIEDLGNICENPSNPDFRLPFHILANTDPNMSMINAQDYLAENILSCHVNRRLSQLDPNLQHLNPQDIQELLSKVRDRGESRDIRRDAVLRDYRRHFPSLQEILNPDYSLPEDSLLAPMLAHTALEIPRLARDPDSELAYNNIMERSSIFSQLRQADQIADQDTGITVDHHRGLSYTPSHSPDVPDDVIRRAIAQAGKYMQSNRARRRNQLENLAAITDGFYAQAPQSASPERGNFREGIANVGSAIRAQTNNFAHNLNQAVARNTNQDPVQSDFSQRQATITPYVPTATSSPRSQNERQDQEASNINSHYERLIADYERRLQEREAELSRISSSLSQAERAQQERSLKALRDQVSELRDHKANFEREEEADRRQRERASSPSAPTARTSVDPFASEGPVFGPSAPRASGPERAPASIAAPSPAGGAMTGAGSLTGGNMSGGTLSAGGRGGAASALGATNRPLNLLEQTIDRRNLISFSPQEFQNLSPDQLRSLVGSEGVTRFEVVSSETNTVQIYEAYIQNGEVQVRLVMEGTEATTPKIVTIFEEESVESIQRSESIQRHRELISTFENALNDLGL